MIIDNLLQQRTDLTIFVGAIFHVMLNGEITYIAGKYNKVMSECCLGHVACRHGLHLVGRYQIAVVALKAQMMEPSIAAAFV